MLLLPLLLLTDLIPGADNMHGHEHVPTAFQGPTSFHVIQISSFVNNTYAQNQGSGWLEDLQIHGWDSDSGTAIFLKLWSKGNFSDAELTEVVETFRVYFIGFTQIVQDRGSEFALTYPFEIQGIANCELHSGENTVSFLRGAFGGVDFLSIQNKSCVPAAQGGSKAQRFCTLVSEYQGLINIIEKLLFNTCPRFLLSVLYAGKAELQRQGHPTSTMVIILAIILPIFILLICLALWYLK
ncbi:T-cell surface glycoprotein CD1b-like isoform X2 [Saccopteryx leptura]|uniref:T-cell surface glycoprotein CD1b-like isoform X2 n=1 Tax=Saccopteryx leptura TaxID=249018 RepID=UPI00339C5E8D